MVTLTDMTALRIWALPGMRERLGNPCYANALDWSFDSMRELNEVEPLLSFSANDPLHVLVSSPCDRPKSDLVVSHVWSGGMPAGALYRLAPGVLLASPEFCCLQVAGRGGMAKTVCVEMECLGLYGRVPGARGFLDRPALLTMGELERWLKEAKGCYGVSNALKALRHALENSRSPMETRAVLVFTLPPEVGGYGLPRPVLNFEIIPLPEDYPISQRPRYVVDACWPQRRTIYEFNSYSDHLSRTSLDNDAMKVNSLKSMGWNVSVVTPAQLSGDALDVLASQLAKDLGVELHRPSSEARDRLLGELL